MRIGFDAKRAFYNARGLGNYSRDLIRILEENHPEHSYWLFRGASRKPAQPYFTPQGTIQGPTGCFSLLPSTLWRSYGIPFSYNSLKLDIFHGLSNEIPHALCAHRTKTVLTMHDLIFLKHPELYPPIDAWLYRKKYLGSCHRADHIIAISHETRRDLMEWGGLSEDKITVVHQGCNPLFRQKPSEEACQSVRERYRLPKDYLLNVAALEERKNQHRILEAMTRMKEKAPLVLVGRPVGSWDKVLREAIRTHGLTDRVRLLSGVPTEDLPAIYHMASAFLYPSQSEGFGIPILEALTCGVPVIATKGGCMEEAGGPDSLYIETADPEELATLADRLLSEAPLRLHMQEKGLTYAGNFSDETIARKIMNVYHHLL
jgi:glycosyltransferase involved in cell wall biosynthesis